MKYYCEDTSEVIRGVDGSEHGLTQAEAERRLEANGKNKLKEAKRTP